MPELANIRDPLYEYFDCEKLMPVFSDFNPLMGGGGLSGGYRPARRSGGNMRGG